MIFFWSKAILRSAVPAELHSGTVLRKRSRNYTPETVSATNCPLKALHIEWHHRGIRNHSQADNKRTLNPKSLSVGWIR
eukprot:9283622-Karenia_brevis.AAC.1